MQYSSNIQYDPTVDKRVDQSLNNIVNNNFAFCSRQDVHSRLLWPELISEKKKLFYTKPKQNNKKFKYNKCANYALPKELEIEIPECALENRELFKSDIDNTMLKVESEIENDHNIASSDNITLNKLFDVKISRNKENNDKKFRRQFTQHQVLPQQIYKKENKDKLPFNVRQNFKKIKTKPELINQEFLINNCSNMFSVVSRDQREKRFIKSEVPPLGKQQYNQFINHVKSPNYSMNKSKHSGHLLFSGISDSNSISPRDHYNEKTILSDKALSTVDLQSGTDVNIKLPTIKSESQLKNIKNCVKFSRRSNRPELFSHEHLTAHEKRFNHISKNSQDSTHDNIYVNINLSKLSPRKDLWPPPPYNIGPTTYRYEKNQRNNNINIDFTKHTLNRASPEFMLHSSNCGLQPIDGKTLSGSLSQRY